MLELSPVPITVTHLPADTTCFELAKGHTLSNAIET